MNEREAVPWVWRFVGLFALGRVFFIFFFSSFLFSSQYSPLLSRQETSVGSSLLVHRARDTHTYILALSFSFSRVFGVDMQCSLESWKEEGGSHIAATAAVP
ncbi:hypothetical protein B0T24DRAFT_631063 [Lasiosphaeria ovina]|uniref:Transmembrane protein n=1 Tax=Lasiosphaeria ovina TaxID=92902 RepID=A0AAE0K3H7_9PEZI|nr:hypothetical protein B0T24DRAFT_631063 [Lasiosphaeria ovina]